MTGPALSDPLSSTAAADHPRADLAGYAERLILGRRATRAFRPTPVPETTLRSVFSLAAAAPSNSNAQPVIQKRGG